MVKVADPWLSVYPCHNQVTLLGMMMRIMTIMMMIVVSSSLGLCANSYAPVAERSRRKHQEMGVDLPSSLTN